MHVSWTRTIVGEGEAGWVRTDPARQQSFSVQWQGHDGPTLGLEVSEDKGEPLHLLSQASLSARYT